MIKPNCGAFYSPMAFLVRKFVVLTVVYRIDFDRTRPELGIAGKLQNPSVNIITYLQAVACIMVIRVHYRVASAKNEASAYFYLSSHP